MEKPLQYPCHLCPLAMTLSVPLLSMGSGSALHHCWVGELGEAVKNSPLWRENIQLLGLISPGPSPPLAVRQAL